MNETVNELKCSTPKEYAKQNLTSLANKKLHCFDLYEAHSDKVGVLHIGVVVGLLFVILLSLAIIILYQRGYFILCGTRGAATYSRAFYKRTSNDYDIQEFLVISTIRIQSKRKRPLYRSSLLSLIFIISFILRYLKYSIVV